MKLKYKIITIISGLFIIYIAAAIILVFSGANYKLVSSYTTEIFDEINYAKSHGNSVTLTSSDLNDISHIYIKKGLTKGNFTIKAVDISLRDNSIILKIPSSYKKVNILLSSEGCIVYNKSKIEYKPYWIKLGNLKLPKIMVLNYLKKYKNDLFSVDCDKILFTNNIFPLKIAEINISKDRMIIKFEKDNTKNVVNSINDTNKTQSLTSTSGGNDASQNSISNNISADPNANISFPQKGANVNGKQDAEQATNNTSVQTNGTTSGTTSSSSNKNQNTSENQSLKKLSEQLSSAVSAAKDNNEKQLLIMIKASIDRKIVDSSYDIKNDSDQAHEAYSKLNPSEKNSLKSNLLGNVDLSNADSLKYLLPK